ncbi:thioredoxin family protein [Shimia abyssi]|uniref:Thioredoxin n=1 Tax=Shimia abyssi TaxID=1662395 RepID=A0A2P8F9H8_9RHOB|nr:thioredoxin family protein [Shimia abyssi]PSL18355.1 thioredoxin [Shimia abyssi]
MNRRDFLITTAVFAALPIAAYAVGTDYAPGLVKKHLEAGDTVFLDFSATWCGTCASQARTINALNAANPAYRENIVFIRVDWDQYGRSDLAKSLRIPRRSTLVVLKGDQELGRIVAGTSKKQIQGLMDTALDAATA